MKVPNRNTYFLLAALSLVCGAAIYPLFRGPHLMVWTVLPMPGFWEMFKIPLNRNSGFLSVFIGSGPDCLWFLSGIFLLRGVWFFERKTQVLYILFFFFIAAAYNAGQYYRVIPGTFDPIDLLAMAGVALTEAIVFNIFIKRGIFKNEKTT